MMAELYSPAKVDNHNNYNVQGFTNAAYEPSSPSLDYNNHISHSTENRVGGVGPTLKDGVDGKDEDNLPCGYGFCEPACCQPMRNIKIFLFFLCCAGAVQGMLVNGFINVGISTLEKRFELPSTQTGIIVSSYDIASVLCLIPVTYLGGKGGRKPRYLGFGIFIMGLGSLVFSLPHFLSGLYIFQNSEIDNSCNDQAGTTGNATMTCGETSEALNSGLAQYKYVLILGQLLHGAGATPLYTLGVTYLDDNLKAKQTSLYAGIFYSMSIVGPAIGYLLGGYFLDIYCDFDSIDVTKLSITLDSPVWVGAWWLGFLCAFILALIVSIPIFAFPKFMPGTAAIRANKVSEAYAGKKVSKEGPEEAQSKGILGVLLAVKTLVTNPTLIFLNLAGASEGFLLAGFASFIPKFIESQFSLTSGWAAILVGLVTVPMGGGGTLTGGYLVKRFDLKIQGIIKLCIGISVCCLLATLTFLINCPVLPFAGINQPYSNLTESLDGVDNPLVAMCNADCGCDRSLYQPLCGSDGIMYFSPCYAGCNVSTVNDTQLYHDCQCIDSAQHTAKEGKCKSDCQMLSPFLALFAFTMLLTFMASMPALTATIRCVPEESKSFALGIQWIMVRCLGTIPGPIAFGFIIDVTCQLWQGSGECDSSLGTCYSYDNKNMAYYLLAMAVIGKFLSMVFFISALSLYKKPPQLPSSSSRIQDGGVSNEGFEGTIKDSSLNNGSTHDIFNGAVKNSSLCNSSTQELIAEKTEFTPL